MSVHANRLPSVSIDVGVEEAASTHIRGGNVALTRSGNHVRSRTYLPDGTEIKVETSIEESYLELGSIANNNVARRHITTREL